MQTFIYGAYTYQYELVRQDRKTISLTVYPDTKIVVKCPEQATLDRVEAFLKRKWKWLDAQLSFFGKFSRKKYPKQYVSGESFLYLGRQFQLVVRNARKECVVMQQGKLIVYTWRKRERGLHVKHLLDEWYTDRVKIVFPDRFEAMLPRFELDVSPSLHVKEMPKRWGSFVNSSKIVLHPALIQAPKQCIDYVIVHELCHVRYKNHSKYFYALLDAKYPKWEKVKELLEARLS
jgi:predicted metal-dependent hydrolase